MRNVDHVKVPVIIKKTCKSIVRLLKQVHCFLFSLYHIVSFIVIFHVVLYYINFGVNHSTVFINNLFDVRHFTVYFVYCSIDIK